MYKVLCMINWITVLWLFKTRAVAASHCSGNQITWVDKNSTFIRCSPCPPCPPGQEFTIPCNTKVLEGTTARCRDCPKGKYSRSFDNKPCVYCKTCSKRYVKRTCTSYRNAKCGDCLSGYYKSEVVFGCVECDKCCYDGKDVAPPGCKKVGMCKPRLHGCPPTPSTASKPTIKPTTKPTTKRLTGWVARQLDKKRVTSAPKQTTKAKVQLSIKQDVLHRQLKVTIKETSPRPTPSSTHENIPSKSVIGGDVESYPQTAKEGGKYTAYQTAVVFLSVALSVTLLGLGGGIAYFISYKRKERRTYSSPGLNRTASFCSSPVDYQPPPSVNDRTLKDFVEKGGDAVEAVCVQLNRRRDGWHEFDKIAIRLSLSQTQRQALLNLYNTGHNATKELFDILCCGNPTFTVKQFAKIVKDIRRNDVYTMLEPFFDKTVDGVDRV